MSITKKDVQHVAGLAMLALTEEETELFSQQLQRILDYFRKLSLVDTKGVEPTTYTIPFTRVMREDRVRGSLSREGVLENAPQKEKGCFRVPRVIE